MVFDRNFFSSIKIKIYDNDFTKRFNELPQNNSVEQSSERLDLTELFLLSYKIQESAYIVDFTFKHIVIEKDLIVSDVDAFRNPRNNNAVLISSLSATKM